VIVENEQKTLWENTTRDKDKEWAWREVSLTAGIFIMAGLTFEKVYGIFLGNRKAVEKKRWDEDQPDCTKPV